MLAPAVGFLCGLVAARLLLGARAFDPADVQWLMIGDRGQAFLGWHLARNEPSTFPLGSLASYLPGLGATLGLADAIPWWSLLLRPASPWLGEVFQQVGPWLVLCYGALGALTVLLLRALTGDGVASVTATLLVLANPVLIARRIHPSLCAHWLLVGALVVYVYAASGRAGRGTRVAAAALVALAAGTHPYLAVMVLGLLLAACWAAHGAARRTIAESLVLVALAWASLWTFGFLTAARSSAPGFGEFSTDLLALVDPSASSTGWSSVLPDLPSAERQYEGFAFLGAGPLLLIALGAALALAGRRRDAPQERGSCVPVRLGPLLVVVLAFAAFALSSRIRLGGRVIASLDALYAMLEPLPSTFRASGRFVWPLYYVLSIGGLALLRCSLRRTATFCALCVVALALQLADGWRSYRSQNVALMALTNPYRALGPEWRGVGADYREIRLLPPALVDGGCDGVHSRFHYMPFAFLAGLERMAVNSGHLSRYPSGVRRWCDAQIEAVRVGRVDPDVVYVVAPALLDELPVLRSAAATCGRLDGHAVCVSSGRASALADRLRASVASGSS